LGEGKKERGSRVSQGKIRPGERRKASTGRNGVGNIRSILLLRGKRRKGVGRIDNSEGRACAFSIPNEGILNSGRRVSEKEEGKGEVLGSDVVN